MRLPDPRIRRDPPSPTEWRIHSLTVIRVAISKRNRRLFTLDHHPGAAHLARSASQDIPHDANQYCLPAQFHR